MKGFFKSVGKMFAVIIGSIVGGVIAIMIVLWLLSLIFVKATEKTFENLPTKPVVSSTK